jgi:GTP-binding protein HflX
VQGRGAEQFCVSLVGYTNAGKSTLMNAVTEADTYAADQLFATLDTKTRRWQVEPGLWAALSDTVGFVRDLPHQLVASFRTTLEEAVSADLLLHVIDASHPQAQQQIDAVHQVLTELGCEPGRILCVLNKSDRVPDPDALAILRAQLPEAIVVSAATGEGLGELASAVARRRRQTWISIRVRAPHVDGKVRAFAIARARLCSETHGEDGAWDAEIELDPAMLPRLRGLSSTIVIEECPPSSSRS